MPVQGNTLSACWLLSKRVDVLKGEREPSDPADASSGAAGRPEQAEGLNYGEFYSAVGKVYTSHQGSNQQLMQQLGPSQRCA